MIEKTIENLGILQLILFPFGIILSAIFTPLYIFQIVCGLFILIAPTQIALLALNYYINVPITKSVSD